MHTNVVHQVRAITLADYVATLGANIFDSSSSWRQPFKNSSSVKLPSLFSSILKQSGGSIFAKARPYWLQMLKDERAGNVWMFDNWLQNTINVSNNYNHFGSFNVRLTRTQYDWRFIYSSNESKFVWLIVQRNVNDGILIKKKSLSTEFVNFATWWPKYAKQTYYVMNMCKCARALIRIAKISFRASLFCTTTLGFPAMSIWLLVFFLFWRWWWHLWRCWRCFHLLKMFLALSSAVSVGFTAPAPSMS